MMRTIIFITGLLLMVSCNNNSKNKEEKEESISGKDTVVTKVPENPSGPDTVFTGGGTEPFWAVYIINNQKIVYHPADGEMISVPFVNAVTTDDITAKYTSVNDSVTMELTLIKNNCNNGMSEIIYPYQVNLKINAITLKGCGNFGKL